MSAPLTLREALRAVGPAVDPAAADVVVGLAAGFTTLHIPTFLRARAQERLQGRVVAVRVGRYGDLPSALADVSGGPAGPLAVLLEWRDLDPRLGVRETVGAPTAAVDDVLTTARLRAARIAAAVEDAATRMSPVALALPRAAVSPVYATGTADAGELAAGLEAVLAETVVRLRAVPALRVVRAGDPVLDLATEIRSGCPYPVATMSSLAGDVAAALWPEPAKKGLITDLDDTLWRGLVGEVGPDGVLWDLDHGGHVHALYQRLLAQFADEGVLLGVASKNDPSVVSSALQRRDLLLPADRIFPVHASWSPKSRAVADILRTWNVAASDVVFVDDSPLELAEVEQAHPGITALRFAAARPDEVWQLCGTLRALFPRRAAGTEDRLRLDSIRAAADVETARGSATDELTFLRDLGGKLVVSPDVTGTARPLELVNKTNQFTLDGARYDSQAWHALARRPGAVTCTIGYSDRFGALGAVSVLAGTAHERMLHVDCWVLSCRAFSRAIEPSLLLALLTQLDLDAAVVRTATTERNAVAREVIGALGASTDDGIVIARTALADDPHAGVLEVEFTPDWPATGSPDRS